MRWHYLSIVMSAFLVFFSPSAYSQGTGSAVSPDTLLSPDDSLQATMYPKMTLLNGPVLVVKYIDPKKFIKADAYTGGGFIVGVYLGKDDLNNINSPQLVMDTSQVQTVTDLSFFNAYDPQHTGQLSEKTLRDGHFILLYYNTNGYLLMRSMANYGVYGLQYDMASNHVNLILDGIQRDKFLQGLVINFAK